MILDGCHFVYGDFNSREHGMIFAHCDTSSYVNLMGAVSSSSFFNKRNKTQYIICDNFEDSPIAFEAEIFSDNFEAFTPQRKRAIEKALFNKPDYRRLYIDIDDDINGETYEYVDGNLKRLYFNCRFMNPIKIQDGKGLVIGYKITIQCDSCMAWQDSIEKTFNIPDNGIISLDIDTDIGGFTYPEVTLYIGSTGGTVTVFNSTDDASRFTKFKNLSANISLIMKGDINYVSGQNYEKFENQNFIRLVDGTNMLSVNGDVSSVKIKWQNRRFV